MPVHNSPILLYTAKINKVPLSTKQIAFFFGGGRDFHFKIQSVSVFKARIQEVWERAWKMNCHPPLRVDLSHNPSCSHLVLPWYRNIGTSLRRTRFVRNSTKGEHLPLRLAPREASEKEWRKAKIRLISPLIEIIN